MQDKFSNCRTCPAFAGHLKILRDKTLKCRTCPANAGRLATLERGDHALSKYITENEL